MLSTAPVYLVGFSLVFFFFFFFICILSYSEAFEPHPQSRRARDQHADGYNFNLPYGAAR